MSTSGVNKPPSKIFGVGLPKTGTSSLTAALCILGFRAVHCLTALPWRRGNFEEDLLEEWDAVTDTPVPIYFPALDLRYPGSKFILTVREQSAWLASIRRHQRGALTDSPTDRARAMLRLLTYGMESFNEPRYRYLQDTHDRNVRWYFRERPRDLLEINICAGEGWGKLCPFLERPVPSMPFPRENVSAVVTA
jgi:Sulfotransferase domain